jgi:hypothetical protein
MRYDPLIAPDPAGWLALGEAVRLEAVQAYHRAAHLPTPRLEAHAAMHVAVESQLALGDPPEIRATLARLLLADGLNRHDAIHAIASVLAARMSDLVGNRLPASDFARVYAAELRKLTKASWQASMTE